MKLKDIKATTLPDAPGVYFFKDKKGDILYIGKATSLKSRVRSYFLDDIVKTRGSKIVTMVLAATTVTFQKTDSVLEAVILEARLIKRYKPYFNTKEKDDKSYNAVVITKEEYPRVLIVRNRNIVDESYGVDMSLFKDRKSIPKVLLRKDIRNIFGPFPSGTTLKEALRIIRRIFPYRDACMPKQGKPCFNAQLSLCPGVCTGHISKKDYEGQIRNIRLFFEGKKDRLLAQLKTQMKKSAQAELFEKAHEIKKILFSLSHIKDISLIKETNHQHEEKEFRIESYDVAHISGTSRVGVMVVVLNGNPEKSEYRKFKLIERVNNDVGGLSELLRRRFKHAEWNTPSLIVVDGGLPQKNEAEKILKELDLHIPVCSVVKNEAHKPKNILTDKALSLHMRKDILLSNSEAHRFAITYHKKIRTSSFLGRKKTK